MDDWNTPKAVSSGYPRIAAKRKTGQERFHRSGQPVGPSLLQFWQWNSSDLTSNATRGCLAEFIVANALGLDDAIRDEWCAFDLLTKSGAKVEVKSSAYLQSWYHKELSNIIFPIRPSRAWNPDTNQMSTELKRQADVYVFCLLNHLKKDEDFDPMNLDQWDFYIVGTRVLDARLPTAKTITLNTLQRLKPYVARYDRLAEAIESCWLKSKSS